MNNKKPYYKHIRDYRISISRTEYTKDGKIGPYEFCTLMRYDGEIAWMPDTEQQHVNPQENVKIWDINKDDIGKIIQEIYLFKAKKKVALETILEKDKILINQMLDDYKSYYKKYKKTIS
ncbi:MAG: hypothetical protein PHV16_02325 [Candidatus Nanoarchaeia archaeon]|nr:hypothetical protein [Candidatus Nanoarchaeia archaeon]